MNKQENWLMRAWHAIFPPKAIVKRHYAAAKVSRLNEGWTTQPTSANYERRISLATLIARSRQASRDDLYIVNYLRLMRVAVIGPKGIQLQSQVRSPRGKLNVKLNKRIEEAWWEWCHAETCTVSGKLDWKGVQNLVVTQCERDGAFLIEMIEADNDFGFSLKVWDVTWLDHTYNDTLPNGNRVIMSVEVDAGDKPVAYWFTTPPSEIMFTPRRDRTRRRVPAERIIHDTPNYDDESQVHGVPGTTAALLPSKNAYSYKESVVMASRVAVNQFAVLKNTAPDGEKQYTGQETPEGEERNPFIDSSPLQITQLLPGWEMQQFKPEHPTQNHPAFKDTLDADIAVALGVPYFLLMGNWKAVNFSSSRGGLGEFRDRVKDYQDFIASKLCRRVFHEWLKCSLVSGKLVLTAPEYAEVQNPAWQPRGFDYIDPTKDINADVTKLQNRLATPSEVLAERGIDYPDFLDRWESDKALAAAKGIDIEAIYSPKVAAPPAPEKPAKEDDDEEKPPQDDAERGYTNGTYAN